MMLRCHGSHGSLEATKLARDEKTRAPRRKSYRSFSHQGRRGAGLFGALVEMLTMKSTPYEEWQHLDNPFMQYLTE